MDVTANLVTPTQLANWMVQSIGTDRANQDQWCYAIADITGAPCPGYDIGNGGGVLTSADTFLEGLRNFQLSANATLQGPGGSGTLPAVAIPSSPAAVTVGAGLLGPTNCQFCIWAKNNPWILVVAAAAIYFGFFYKK